MQATAPQHSLPRAPRCRCHTPPPLLPPPPPAASRRRHGATSIRQQQQSGRCRLRVASADSTSGTAAEPLQAQQAPLQQQQQQAPPLPPPPPQQQQQQPLITFAEVRRIAAARGMHLSLKTLGPGYRIVCRDGGPEGPILGVTSGFVAQPFGLMHCDTLQIFTRGMKGQQGWRVRQNALGLGLLLGGAVFSHGHACGCRKAEILAINDDDAWHERLVRYYSYFGFQPVCKVGGNGFFADLPHLLVWGGEGTRMDADIPAMLAKWGPALQQRMPAPGAAGAAGAGGCGSSGEPPGASRE